MLTPPCRVCRRHHRPTSFSTLCCEIVARLPKRDIPSFVQVEPGQETRWKLGAICERSDPREDEESIGYPWPASCLTDGDRRRLTVMSNLTGIPITRLLRMAVHLLFEQTSSAMQGIVQQHEQTGKPLESLFGRVTVDDATNHIRAHPPARSNNQAPSSPTPAQKQTTQLQLWYEPPSHPNSDPAPLLAAEAEPRPTRHHRENDRTAMPDVCRLTAHRP